MGDEVLAVLFTDVEASTALYAAKGDTEARAILAAVDDLSRQQVTAHGGRTIKSLGDGLMAAFTSPRRAVTCALAIQAAVAERSAHLPDQRVRVRAGLHIGEATAMEGDLAGEAVAAAARICAKANGGEVLASEVVRQVCGALSGTVFEDRGRVALKGFPNRWRVFRVAATEAPRAACLEQSHADWPTVRVLGPLEVLSSGVAVTIGPGRERALLSALALRPGRSATIDQLTAALWGDDAPPTALKALQTYVSHLRRVLPGETIRTVPGAYVLDIGPEQVDALQFEALVGTGHRLLEHGDAAGALRELARAVHLWRGAPVPDLVDQAPGRAEAVRLTELLRSAEEDLAEARLVLGEHAVLVPDLERAVAAEPLRERRWAQLMRALYHAGRQGDALEAYRRIRRRLADELGIEPTLELRRLERAILRQEVPSPQTSAPATPPDSPLATPPAPSLGRERTPYVGRVSERGELVALLTRAHGGRGGLVMIGGEPGVGKSRLSEEIAADAQLAGFQVLVGHCYAWQADVPYTPWVEIVESAARATPSDVFLDRLGDAASELARMVPALRARFPTIPPSLELPPDQQRRYMFSCLGDFMARISAAQPRLYILEDLHWADESTLLFLEYLAGRVSTVPLLVVGTHRDDPIDLSPRLAEMLGVLVRSPSARLIRLQPHTETEVAVILEELSGTSPPTSVTASVYAETNGNALFVEELYRHLMETGRLLDGQGNFRTDPIIDDLDVPDNVRLVTARRLERLSAPTRRLLTLAAVVGRRCDVELLEAIAGITSNALLDAVDEAERAGIVRIESAGWQSDLCFTHELVRQAALTIEPELRRRQHHLAVADALEHRHAAELRIHAADIAHHLVQSGQPGSEARTARYLALAADHALEAAAYEEGLRHLARAMTLTAADDTRARVDLLLKRGLAQRGLCRWNEVVQTCDETLAALAELGDLAAVAAVCWELGVALGWAHRFADMLAITERALDIIGPTPGPDRAWALAARAVGLFQASRLEESAVAVADARGLADEHGDDRLRANVGVVETTHAYYTMSMDLAVRRGRDVAEGIRRLGNTWDLVTLLPFLESALVSTGHLRESDELGRELGPLAERVGHTGAVSLSRRSRIGRTAATAPDLEELETLAALQQETACILGGYRIAEASTLRGIVRFWCGDWPAATRHLEDGVRQALPGFWFGIHHGFLALFRAFSGDGEAALALLETVREQIPQPERFSSIGQWNLALLEAETAAVLGEAGRAQLAYPRVQEVLRGGTLLRQYDVALVERTAAMAAAAAGFTELAEAHFETALRQVEELPHLIEGPTVNHVYGRFLLRRGAPADLLRARRLLEDAVSGYRRLGMPRHEAMARLLRVEAGDGEVAAPD